MCDFHLTNKVRILTKNSDKVILTAIKRFERDLLMTLHDNDDAHGVIELLDRSMPLESYQIVVEVHKVSIYAGDPLGFVYALLWISETYLDITPFWFWNEVQLEKKEEMRIPLGTYESKQKAIVYRGWFINDEVLLHKWTIEGDALLPWEMAFEALLRCGGNMVIPGTDENSRKYRVLASDMGLSITHHHAEPLGAKMFARAYPELTPSYDEYGELFDGLWEEAIKEQESMNIIWNLGFRGQGDYPFWKNDPKYKTPESRGKLISEIITKQYEMIKEKVKAPACCTNLYGEIMELYNEGHINLPNEVIKIWADNGYGKMVNRRQGSHNPRVVALPKASEDNKSAQKHGAYYHVSFYDLQGANHMTMSPNSVKFYGEELKHAYERGIKDFFIVNGSNIKPHAYFLELIREFWTEGEVDWTTFDNTYVNKYYKGLEEDRVNEVIKCYDAYTTSAISFGPNEDEKAGEQFYNYTTRVMAFEWMKSNTTNGSKTLQWIYKDMNYGQQIEAYANHCEDAYKKFLALDQQCELLAKTLPETSKRAFNIGLRLHVKIHLHCLEGAVAFCQSYKSFDVKDYKEAFYLCGIAKEKYQLADQAMRDMEEGIWKGYYENDCLSDSKFTAHILRNLMGHIRNIGDGPHYFHWQRDYLYSREDRDVMLITNMDNHLTDGELFNYMKEAKTH